MDDQEGTLLIEYDDTKVETKISLTRFGGTFGTKSFHERSFLNTLLGLTPFLDYKPTNEYISEKTIILCTIHKFPLKGDFIDGCVIKGVRESFLCSFDQDKPPRFKLFCEPKTVQFKKKQFRFQ